MARRQLHKYRDVASICEVTGGAPGTRGASLEHQHMEASMNDQRSRPPDHQRNGDVGGPCPIGRRSFLRGVVGGVAGAITANSIGSGVAQAAKQDNSNATQDNYNMEATREGTRSVPFYGQYQAGIATPPQTAATFVSFDVTAT